MKLKLFLDSASDITIDMANNIDAVIIPLTVISDNIEYRDGVDIDSKQLTDRMRNGDVFTTSQVTYEQFYTKFKKEILKGNDILYISLSSGISGCFSSAIMAKNSILEEMPEANIYVIDSKCASYGIYLVAKRIARMIQRNFDIEYIINKAKFLCNNVEHYFTVDDMKYLYRGGRVTATQKIIGGMLNIKPLLTIDKINGKLISIDKSRGLKQVFKKIIENIKNDTIGNIALENATIAIVHSDSLENAMELSDMIQKDLKIKNIILGNIGPTIASHTGPGCIAVMVNKNEIGDSLDII